MRPTEEVKVEQRDDRQVHTHPAFSVIRADRISGLTYLFNSDFGHHNWIRIRISNTELQRSLSTDWTHEKGSPYIEVDVSEAQWAHLISSLNGAYATPCTLRYRNNEKMPDLPPPASREKQINSEMMETVHDVLKRIEDLSKKVSEDTGLNAKKRNALNFELGVIHSHLKSNLPFIAKLFGEHVEKTVEKMKVEVHAYMNGVVQRTGLAALGAKPPLQISHDESET